MNRRSFWLCPGGAWDPSDVHWHHKQIIVFEEMATCNILTSEPRLTRWIDLGSCLDMKPSSWLSIWPLWLMFAGQIDLCSSLKPRSTCYVDLAFIPTLLPWPWKTHQVGISLALNFAPRWPDSLWVHIPMALLIHPWLASAWSQNHSYRIHIYKGASKKPLSCGLKMIFHGDCPHLLAKTGVRVCSWHHVSIENGCAVCLLGIPSPLPTDLSSSMMSDSELV